MENNELLAIFDDFLTKKRLYHTFARRQIATFASQQLAPFDPQQLWNHLKHQGIGLTTIYRTLDLLVDAGLIRQLPGSQSRYEVIYKRMAKEYFRCDQCGTWTPFPSSEVDGELASIAERMGFAIKTCSIMLTGICRTCRKGDKVNQNVEPASVNPFSNQS